mmetsp:Transcript_88267/g.263211  ORF Transcript_88267/g.263211 Transcript_88267/m.263211 type:complete len:272 (+) Transcript_88267:238-1053(+)
MQTDHLPSCSGSVILHTPVTPHSSADSVKESCLSRWAYTSTARAATSSAQSTTNATSTCPPPFQLSVSEQNSGMKEAVGSCCSRSTSTGSDWTRLVRGTPNPRAESSPFWIPSPGRVGALGIGGPGGAYASSGDPCAAALSCAADQGWTLGAAGKVWRAACAPGRCSGATRPESAGGLAWSMPRAPAVAAPAVAAITLSPAAGSAHDAAAWPWAPLSLGEPQLPRPGGASVTASSWAARPSSPCPAQTRTSLAVSSLRGAGARRQPQMNSE